MTGIRANSTWWHILLQLYYQGKSTLREKWLCKINIVDFPRRNGLLIIFMGENSTMSPFFRWEILLRKNHSHFFGRKTTRSKQLLSDSNRNLLTEISYNCNVHCARTNVYKSNREYLNMQNADIQSKTKYALGN